MLARDWQTSPSRTILSGLKKGRKGKGKKVCGATKAEILPSFKPEFFYRDSSSGCIAKGYSTIAWTPFFLKITIRCTWPLGALIVCSTSCNTENKEGRFWQMSQIRYWKDADSIVAWNMQWQGYLRLPSLFAHTWISTRHRYYKLHVSIYIVVYRYCNNVTEFARRICNSSTSRYISLKKYSRKTRWKKLWIRYSSNEIDLPSIYL